MRRILAVWLIAIFSLTNIASVSQPSHLIKGGTPITFEGYWELVRNTRQAIVRMESLTKSEIRKQLDENAAQWEKVTALEFPDKSTVPVDSSYLVGELKKDSPDLKRLEALLNTLLKAHVEYPQKIFTVQDIQPLTEILARPEFQWDAAPAAQTPDWVQKIFDAFANLMDRFAYAIQNAVYYGRAPLIIIGVIIFILSLLFISRNLSRNLVREAELAAESSDSDSALTSKGAMQRAQTLSSQGDYRNAVRYLYLSSLLILDSRDCCAMIVRARTVNICGASPRNHNWRTHCVM